MSDEPWVTNAPGSSAAMIGAKLRPPEAVLSDDAFLDITIRQERGEGMGPERFPSRMETNVRVRFKEQSDLICMGVIVVSGRAAEALRPFDLGDGGLYPVEIRHRQAAHSGLIRSGVPITSGR